jgi:hypothetical protein
MTDRSLKLTQWALVVLLYAITASTAYCVIACPILFLKGVFLVEAVVAAITSIVFTKNMLYESSE